MGQPGSSEPPRVQNDRRMMRVIMLQFFVLGHADIHTDGHTHIGVCVCVRVFD